jgi:hypothetical protein
MLTEYVLPHDCLVLKRCKRLKATSSHLAKRLMSIHTKMQVQNSILFYYCYLYLSVVTVLFCADLLWATQSKTAGKLPPSNH